MTPTITTGVDWTATLSLVWAGACIVGAALLLVRRRPRTDPTRCPDPWVSSGAAECVSRCEKHPPCVEGRR